MNGTVELIKRCGNNNIMINLLKKGDMFGHKSFIS